MPIEIRELVIKAHIDPGGKRENAVTPSQLPDREELIADCVEQVMQILRDQLER